MCAFVSEGRAPAEEIQVQTTQPVITSRRLGPLNDAYGWLMERQEINWICEYFTDILSGQWTDWYSLEKLPPQILPQMLQSGPRPKGGSLCLHLARVQSDSQVGDIRVNSWHSQYPNELGCQLTVGPWKCELSRCLNQLIAVSSSVSTTALNGLKRCLLWDYKTS